MTEPAGERVPLSEVFDGDTVLAAGTPYEVARDGDLYSVRDLSAGGTREWSAVFNDSPSQPIVAIARLFRSPVTMAVRTLRAGGIEVQAIRHP